MSKKTLQKIGLIDIGEVSVLILYIDFDNKFGIA